MHQGNTNTKEPFSKTFSKAENLLTLLKDRGLSISNEKQALNYLTHIGYFRLSAYFFPLLEEPKQNHVFCKDATFDYVLETYRFDRKFRLLLFNEIEKIEIAIRSVITNVVCNELKDEFWITNPYYFNDSVRYEKTLKYIDNEYSNSSEVFITHFKNKYNNPYPPAWVLVEIVSIGVLRNIYMNLRSKRLKKLIADHFGLPHVVFTSWINAIAGLRNMCCHHARTWNREHPITLLNLSKNQAVHPWIESLNIDTSRVYYRLCIIRYFLKTISPQNTLPQKIDSLFKSYPAIDMKILGFPDKWEKEPLWQ